MKETGCHMFFQFFFFVMENYKSCFWFSEMNVQIVYIHELNVAE